MSPSGDSAVPLSILQQSDTMIRFARWMPACLLACVLSSPVLAEESNKLSQSEELSGWKLLFDGKSTEGWRNYKQDRVSDGWVVENGELIRKDKNAGDIITKDQYDAFELSLDYKITKAGNSGLMFHVTEDEGAPYLTGPEVQIQDNVDGRDPQKAGWLYQLYEPGKDRDSGEPKDATRPVGEWNQIYLKVSPNGSELRMNGEQYYTFNKGDASWKERVSKSKFKDWANFGVPEKGHICLQDHNDVVAFRNIKIRELKDSQQAPGISTGEVDLKAVVAFPKLEFEGWSAEDENGRTQLFRTILVTAPQDGSNKLYVADQYGQVWGFENRPDVTEGKLFLDIRDRVSYNDSQNEEGFLGFTFHPKFKENGFVYAFYTAKQTKLSIISRFELAKDGSGRIDPASEKEIYRLEQPFWNHNGGTVIFGPDGYLYATFGDGGAGDDPFDHGQNLSNVFGTVIRIDVDREEGGNPFAIPADNPFVGQENVKPEIWAYGFRNIWRMDFDSKTGHLWAGDVGQNLWEEIDIVVKGGNYGWARREGTHPFGKKKIDLKTVIDPIWEYDHEVGKSITGGVLYRGEKLPELQGKYVYADYVTGKIWALHYDEDAKKVISNETIPTPTFSVMSFGTDAEGELYFCVSSPNAKGIYKFEKK